MAGRRPIAPHPSLTRVTDQDTQRALETAHLRLRELETRSNEGNSLSGSIAAAFANLSGTIDARINEIVGSSGLTEVSHDSTLSGDGTSGDPLSANPAISTVNGSIASGDLAVFASLQTGVTASLNSLSGTINARVVSLSGSVDSAWKTGDAALWTSIQTGTTSSIASLSGTVNSNFVHLSATMVGLSSSFNTAWQTGDSGLYGSLSTVDNARATGDAAIWNSLQVGTTSSIASLSGTINAKFLTIDTAALSGTINARFVHLSATVVAIDAAWVIGDSNLYGSLSTVDAARASGDAAIWNSLQTGTTSSIASLSGTINARFVDLSGSLTGKFAQVAADLLESEGAVDAALTNLSGTINAKFVSISGSLVSGTLDAQRVWDGLDPLRGTRLFEDYIQNGNVTTHLGGGTNSVTYDRYQAGHPGIARLNVLTSGTALASAVLSDGPDFNSKVFIGGGPIEYEACFYFSNLDNGTNDASRRVGFSDLNTAPTDCIMLEVSRTRYGDNEFRFVTAATGSRVQQRTGVTITDGKWFRGRINVSRDGDAVTGSIFCSGTLLSAVATRTYVPVNSSSPNLWPGAQAIKTLGGGVTCILNVDYQYFQQTFTGSRI